MRSDPYERLMRQSVPHPVCGGLTLPPGRTRSHGYLRVGKSVGHKKSVLVAAHRLVWEHNNGQIPTGMVICHKCDQRDCFDVTHLFSGNQADNLADMASKGRSTRGTKSVRAKLTETQVLAILAAPRTTKLIAAEYEVTVRTVWDIRYGISWSWLTGIERRGA
jgi:lambda repressor-like predicted transcriptional regulator